MRIIICWKKPTCKAVSALQQKRGYHDTVRTLVFTGRPMRVGKNPYVMDWEENRVPDVGELSAAFDLPMRRRLKAFVVELREKRKEMPDPCATWDQNGGDLGNGNWPAARINAADKQYTLEAVQAP